MKLDLTHTRCAVDTFCVIIFIGPDWVVILERFPARKLCCSAMHSRVRNKTCDAILESQSNESG